MAPRIAETDDEIDRCHAAMAGLRPHVARESFVAIVRAMYKEGYRLAYLENENDVVAVAGYRIATNLHLGRHLYIEDLSTAEVAQSRGYGRDLLNWLEGEAEREGCTAVHLDSGVQRERAHKFYFRQDYTIAAYHFLKKVTWS